MNTPLFRAEGLVKHYNGQRVVDDLSLTIAPGECLGVIGPNGAGKTTTLRMCLGLVVPDAGRIEIFGLPVPAAVREAKKRIGVVTQFDSLDPDFTCAENLRVFGRYFGLPRATDRRARATPARIRRAAIQGRAPGPASCPAA